MSTTTEKATMTVKEFANWLGVSLPTAYNITEQENFYPLIRVGRKKLINKQSVNKWLEEQQG